MSLLDQIVEGATEDSVTTANLLRKIIVVGRRIHAPEVQLWVENELNGYRSPETLPAYRGPLTVAVRGTYSGPWGSRATQVLSETDVSDEYIGLFRVNFIQPLAELEEVASRTDDADLGVPWTAAAVAQWNEWEAEGRVSRFEWMGLIGANRVVTRMMVRGVVDIVRSKALEFALELQEADPAAGQTGGPTTEDSKVRQAVTSVVNNIYGQGANIAIGDNNVQSLSVAQGDVLALLNAARQLGLNRDAINELASIATSSEEPDEKLSKARGFADKIRKGSIAVSGNVAANLVAAQILTLIGQFLA